MTKSNGRRVRVLVGAILLGGLLFECQRALTSDGTLVPAVAVEGPRRGANVALAAPSPDLKEKIPTVEELAGKDPIAFLQRALDNYDRSVRDYTCIFTKQEMVNGRMTEEQVMKADFRERPFSVRLEWIKNMDKASRVLYVADRWVKDGKQLAVVEPGAIARLFVSHVMREINGKDAQKSSRRSIDQFGLRNSLALVIKYAKMGLDQGVGTFAYVGNGKVNERETLVFERHLPYTDESGEWPDRVLIVHLDKELLLPTLCAAYADEAKENLLGRYMTTDVKINANLDDEVFTKKGMGIE